MAYVRSYEGFGDVFVRVTLPDGRALPEPPPPGTGAFAAPPPSSPAPPSAAEASGSASDAQVEPGEAASAEPVERAWVRGAWFARLPGWHAERTSVPELLAVRAKERERACA